MTSIPRTISLPPRNPHLLPADNAFLKSSRKCDLASLNWRYNSGVTRLVYYPPTGEKATQYHAPLNVHGLNSLRKEKVALAGSQGFYLASTSTAFISRRTSIEDSYFNSQHLEVIALQAWLSCGNWAFWKRLWTRSYHPSSPSTISGKTQ